MRNIVPQTSMSSNLAKMRPCQCQIWPIEKSLCQPRIVNLSTISRSRVDIERLTQKFKVQLTALTFHNRALKTTLWDVSLPIHLSIGQSQNNLCGCMVNVTEIRHMIGSPSRKYPPPAHASSTQEQQQQPPPATPGHESSCTHTHHTPPPPPHTPCHEDPCANDNTAHGQTGSALRPLSLTDNTTSCLGVDVEVTRVWGKT